jgi:hypothetical protein
MTTKMSCNLFPTLAQNHLEITIEHLLTISPGIHWPEFSDWGGTCLPMCNSNNWIKFFFERDIIESPGKIAKLHKSDHLNDFAKRYARFTKFKDFPQPPTENDTQSMAEY